MNGWYLYDSDLYKDDIKLGMDDALTKGYILSAGLVLGNSLLFMDRKSIKIKRIYTIRNVKI